MLQRLLQFSLILLLLPASLAAASAKDALDTINMAGRQRMLSQRIVKNYTQLGLGVMSDAAERQLQDSVAQFDSNLNALKLRAANWPASAEPLNQLDGEWRKLKPLLVFRPSKEAVLTLDSQAERVLTASHKLTLTLQDQSGVDAGRWVNLAGRTRMLSQRLAKYAMLRRWGVDSALARDAAEQARTELSGALTNLTQSPANYDAIRRQLDLANQQWLFFESALNQAQGDLSHVATTSERMVEVMDVVTKLYAGANRTASK